ncbi:hypothetical protein D3C86_2133830 [compost metagenome]
MLKVALFAPEVMLRTMARPVCDSMSAIRPVSAFSSCFRLNFPETLNEVRSSWGRVTEPAANSPASSKTFSSTSSKSSNLDL